MEKMASSASPVAVAPGAVAVVQPGQRRKRVKLACTVIGLIAVSFLSAFFANWVMHCMSQFSPLTFHPVHWC